MEIAKFIAYQIAFVEAHREQKPARPVSRIGRR
jgi:hypothetical protein